MKKRIEKTDKKRVKKSSPAAKPEPSVAQVKFVAKVRRSSIATIAQMLNDHTEMYHEANCIVLNLIDLATQGKVTKPEGMTFAFTHEDETIGVRVYDGIAALKLAEAWALCHLNGN